MILWFGVGEFSKVLLVFIGAFFSGGIKYGYRCEYGGPYVLKCRPCVQCQYLSNAAPCGYAGSPPGCHAGVKIALSSGWMVVVAAEMIASKSGLGFLITRGNESYDVALVLCGMILIGLVGAVLSAVFTLMERWLCPWTEKKNG